MKQEIQTKRNLAVLLTVTVVLAPGLAPIGSAKKPTPPPEPPEDARYTLQAFVDCAAADLNNAGHVVGQMANADDGGYHACLLTPVEAGGELVWFQDTNGDGVNDLLEDLGTLGSNNSWAAAINDLMEVVGASTGTDGAEHAFLWTRANGMIDLGSLGGDQDWSMAHAINGARQVVGQTTGDTFDGFHAFLWEDSNDNGQSDPGEMIDLGTLGGTESTADFIHDSGIVLGGADVAGDNAHAFLIVPADVDADGDLDWFADENTDGINDLMIDLGTFGGAESWANAMNDWGQIAGTAQLNNGDANRAFLLTPLDDNGDLVWFEDSDGDGINDLMADLGTLEDHTGSSAYDLNDAGQVVGESRKVKGSRPGHMKITREPFLWEGGEMENLNSLTDSDTSIGGARINNAGQILSAYHILLPLPVDP